MTQTAATIPNAHGFVRSDGRCGIRNVVLVAYLVECAHHVAREITLQFREPSEQAGLNAQSEQGDASPPVHLIGFPGCYPNRYAHRMMQALCTHPNVGGVLLLSLGCEGFHRSDLAKTIQASGRPVQTLVIQESGGTRKTLAAGVKLVREMQEQIRHVPRRPLQWSDLIIGTICGGSDATSGITANPAIGLAFDQLVQHGATCIFEETGELLGCEQHMAARAITPELGREIIASVAKAERYYQTLGHGSFAPGNAEGGLTTQEEKSLGAYTKSGHGPIHGLIKPGDIPAQPGLYLLDVVPDGEVRFGFPNIADNAEIVELIACGSHIILFSTGRGSVVGSAISPVVKVCANPRTYERMSDDMDINAGAVLDGTCTLDDIGKVIVDVVKDAARGTKTASESLCHQEFILTYKSFEPVGPSCLPLARG